MKQKIFKFGYIHITRLAMLLILLISGTSSLFAHYLTIHSFSPEPFDLSASVNPKLDLNGTAGALLKITFDKEPADVKIEGNVIDQSLDGSEIHTYITSGTKSIVIKAKGYSPIKICFSDYGVYRLLSKQVYSLSLRLKSTSNAANENTYSSPSIHELLRNPDGDPIDQIVEEANSLYSNGKVAEAVPLLEKAASLGHPEALLSLGLLYEKGVRAKGNWILSPNASKAFINVQNSAQQGFSPAQNVLYRYYLTGVGVDVDRARAELWKTLYDRTQDSQVSAEENDNVFTCVEQMPEYPGGEKKLLNDVVEHLKYPELGQYNGIQGKVTLKFVVKKDGSIGEIIVLNNSCYYTKENIGEDGKVMKEKIAVKDFESAAIDAIRNLSNFYPGKMNAFPVNVWYTLPITFQLQQ